MFPKICHILEESLNEWPGHISDIIFLAGCNMRCPYCHGWRFVLNPTDFDPIPHKALMTRMAKTEGWVDGIVVSGGEPCLNPSIIDLLGFLRNYERDIKIHSNGSKPEVLEDIIFRNLADCVALDYKTQHSRIREVSQVDISPEAIKLSFNHVRHSEREREYHTTICPAFLSLEDLKEMAEDLDPDGWWFLQKYNPEDVLNLEKAGTETLSDEEFMTWAREVKKIRGKIRVSGVSSGAAIL